MNILQTLPLPVLAVVAVVLIVLIVAAYRSGREISFWPPKIGPLPRQGSSPESDHSQPMGTPSTLAEKVLVSLQLALRRSSNSYVINDETEHNAETAIRLFQQLTGDVVATAFFESPNYETDFAINLARGVKFIRITSSNVCDAETARAVRKRLHGLKADASLVVIPESEPISKIGGIFARLPDRSYLAFIALNRNHTAENSGLVFCDDIAKNLFDYYWGTARSVSSRGEAT